METVKIKIDGREHVVDKSLTILEAARSVGYDIPTLCHYKDLVQSGACRVCLVEVKGARTLVTSCTYPVNEGLEVTINSPRAKAGRRQSVELILSNHSKECLTCENNQKCELQTVADRVGARNIKFEGEKTHATVDTVSPSICRDTSKCILCGRCVAACKKYQKLGILGFQNRGFDTIVAPAENRSFAEVPCMYCGQCVNVCPTGALYVKEEINDVLKAIKAGKHVVVQTAPAVRASIGEEFGLPMGTRATGKMCAALRRAGFHKVYDTNFAADLTIMEEGTELITRVTKALSGEKVALPMITSCSPGWIRHIELDYPTLLPNLSTCKSPHMMMGAIIKTYYAQQKGIDPKDIFVVSIMPCSAKKFEKTREEMFMEGGYPNVDAVLTTRELGDFIKQAGIDFNSLPDEGFDQDLLGEYTGAGVIFGVTGGVMEAALRTAYFVLEGKEAPSIEFHAVRGFEGVKEATVHIDRLNLDVKVAIAHSMAYADPILDEMKAGKSPYHFIEVMGCPGGCVNGGGQSFVKPGLLSLKDKANIGRQMQLRANALYEEDEKSVLRRSHENQQLKDLYKNFLHEPNGHLSHELLHTHYVKRERFPKK